MFEEKFRESDVPLKPMLVKIVNVEFDYDRELSLPEISEALDRHKTGDWGECTVAEQEANEVALVHGGCVLSVFRNEIGRKFCVLTEYVETESPETSVLLFSDYLKMAG